MDPLSRRDMSPSKILSQHPDPKRIIAVLEFTGLKGHNTTIFLSWCTKSTCPFDPFLFCWYCVCALKATDKIDKIIRNKFVPWRDQFDINSFNGIRWLLVLNGRQRLTPGVLLWMSSIFSIEIGILGQKIPVPVLIGGLLKPSGRWRWFGVSWRTLSSLFCSWTWPATGESTIVFELDTVSKSEVKWFFEKGLSKKLGWK